MESTKNINNMNEENELKIQLAATMHLALRQTINTLERKLIMKTNDFKDLRLILNKIINNINQLELIDTELEYKVELVDEIVMLQEDYWSQTELILRYADDCIEDYNLVGGLIIEFEKLGIYNAFIGLEVEYLGSMSNEEMLQKAKEMKNNHYACGIYDVSTGENHIINDWGEIPNEEHNRFTQYIMDYYRGDQE